MTKRANLIGPIVFASMASAVALPVSAGVVTSFKQTNVHFETNASACDMGIQMSLDTDGITWGKVENPYGQLVFGFGAMFGQQEVGDITEMFQERVEPPIIELEEALGCEFSDDAVTLDELLGAWPAGVYEFEGFTGRELFQGEAELSHKIPAGPRIVKPQDGDIVRDDRNLRVRWKKVTEAIIHELGPVTVVGYHVVVADVTVPTLAPGETKKSYDVDVPGSATSVIIPKEFLVPNKIYAFEVLATEESGNQTISEGGVFCTGSITPDDCVEP
ncbi:hypothetical protein P886_1242 [Alteromonadaceae bacterium 2753L.S.0a.02]|nr:hypothetical protein P886_1242 [Alteromonadaceae bacterium 2753L.S.0a.02]